MGEISKQLNLDFVPKTISDVLSHVSRIDNLSMKSSKLDFHIRLLEEELRKVDAFKRELPYCMNLLQDAIETLRKEREEEREELIAVESGEGRVESSDRNLKKTWMTCVRLWNAPVQFHNENQTVPFKSRGLGMTEGKWVEEVSVPVPVEAIDLGGKNLLVSNQKKKRRSWSPHMHREFVDVLLRLGGPYVATPKQIRELMKVDGLTNDEVKSHLQKYRLHIKKLPSASVTLAHSSPITHGSIGEDDVRKS
ncbi:myb family transcription factor EFM isoform X1 [Salvia divinorum]|uniref:Myb family transcription factor EFM isoform X1 n=1 Tax=Salvia divinorum TaxID=28513 RepID=A0ABD1GRL5_SALDI